MEKLINALKDGFRIVTRAQLKAEKKSTRTKGGAVGQLKMYNELLMDPKSTQAEKNDLIKKINALRLIVSNRKMAAKVKASARRRKNRYGTKYVIKPIFMQEVFFNTGKKDDEGQPIVEARLFPKIGTSIFSEVIKIWTEKLRDEYLEKLMNKKSMTDAKFDKIERKIVIGVEGVNAKLDELRSKYANNTTRIVDFKAFLKKSYRPLERTIIKSGTAGRAVPR